MGKPEISSELSAKWGTAAMSDGFQAVPHSLFRHQHDLKLSDGELVVLLNVLDFWWKAAQRPFPSASTIAKRIGAADRTVRRHLKSLEIKGYAIKKKSEREARIEFDFNGLVHRLAELVLRKP